MDKKQFYGQRQRYCANQTTVACSFALSQGGVLGVNVRAQEIGQAG